MTDIKHDAPKPAPAARGAGDSMVTEQEKDKSGAVRGVGPATHSMSDFTPAETIEDLGIGPRDPYPEGNPPPPPADVLANIEATKKELSHPAKKEAHK